MEQPSAYSRKFINDLMLSKVQEQSRNEHLEPIIKKQEAKIKQLEDGNDLLQKRFDLLQKQYDLLQKRYD
jgi:uncharacterized protein HemX